LVHRGVMPTYAIGAQSTLPEIKLDTQWDRDFEVVKAHAAALFQKAVDSSTTVDYPARCVIWLKGAEPKAHECSSKQAIEQIPLL